MESSGRVWLGARSDRRFSRVFFSGLEMAQVAGIAIKVGGAHLSNERNSGTRTAERRLWL